MVPLPLSLKLLFPYADKSCNLLNVLLSNGCQRMLRRSKKALEDEVGEGEKKSVILVPQMIECATYKFENSLIFDVSEDSVKIHFH